MVSYWKVTTNEIGPQLNKHILKYVNKTLHFRDPALLYCSSLFQNSIYQYPLPNKLKTKITNIREPVFLPCLLNPNLFQTKAQKSWGKVFLLHKFSCRVSIFNEVNLLLEFLVSSKIAFCIFRLKKRVNKAQVLIT